MSQEIYFNFHLYILYLFNILFLFNTDKISGKITTNN